MRCWTCGGIEIMGSMEAHRSPNHTLDGTETCYAAFNGYQSGIYYYRTLLRESGPETSTQKVDEGTVTGFRGFGPRKK